jgi:type II secretory pathway pseudopilin PulG
MRNPFRTSIGQFSTAGGRAQPRAANVRAVEPAANLNGAERGNLYMLVEVSGSGGGHAALYRQLLNAAQTAFYEAEGTLPSALVRAVRSAHSALRRANEALSEADWRAGITCAVLHGAELTIAQAGPALILVAHPKTVDMFPDGPGDFTPPLGGEERPDVQLLRTPIEPGSTILIAQSGWLERVAPDRLASATTLDNAGQIVDYLGQLAGDAELSALVVTLTSALPEVLDLAAHPAPVVALKSQVTSTRPPATAAPATGRPVSNARDGGRRASAPPVEPAASLADETAVGARRWTPPIAAVAAEGAQTPEAPGGAVDEAIVLDEEDAPRRSVWPLILAIVVIPVLIVLLVLAMLWWRGQANEKTFQSYIQAANTAISEAQGLPDEAAARLRLASARDYLDRATGLRSTDPALTAAQGKYDDIMDRLNKVTPLYGVISLYQFKGTDHKLDRVVSNGIDLFVLDRGAQVVDHFALSATGDSVTPYPNYVVISKTQRLKDGVVGDLVDIAWAEAAVTNQHSQLLTLDASIGLVGYSSSLGAARVPVTGREQWSYPELITSYNGNLYIADTKANQLWRYRPSENGYENAPEPYFAKGKEVDLTGLRSMAIDGNVWLLFADGRLLKFFAGEAQSFELNGLPDKLRSPAAVVVSREGDQLYIADGAKGRILEFSKDGKFQRQFRAAEPTAFTDLRSFYLDEGTRLFYILAADQLYKADLPQAAP